MPRWILILSFLAWFPSLSQAYLLVNGDFEAVDLRGWVYRGENDGSYGIFTDSTRPDSHVFMLQLDSNGAPGYSSVSQSVKLERGQSYRLSLDLYDGNAQTDAGDFQVVSINGAHAFSHHLTKGLPMEGWERREIFFRAEEENVEITIAVRGATGDREGSTTLVDNVLLGLSAQKFEPPLRRGKPLAAVTQRDSLPTSIAYGENGVSLTGYEPIQLYRDAFGHNPAMSTWFGGWDIFDAQGFEATRNAVDPWVQQGVVPIVAPDTLAGKTADILAGAHDAYFLNWAEQARDWGYPLILRPWREMDTTRLGFGPGQSTSPDDFVKLWRHVRGLFYQAGADNVLWFWTPSTLDNQTRKYYPGPKNVDIVGCSLYADWGTDALREFADYHQKHYKNRAFAIAQGASEKGRQAAWLSAILNNALTQYPRLEFYTHYNFNDSLEGKDYRIEHTEGAAEVYKSWLARPSTKHRLEQVLPPKMDVTVLRSGQIGEAIVINLGGKHTLPVNKLLVEFWDGPPQSDGANRIGEAEDVVLKVGESVTLRQDLPEELKGKLYVSVDPSVDPSFMTQAVDPADVGIYAE